MNNDLFVKPPDQPDESWETTVREIARDFAYPPTPDIVQQTSQQLVRSRRTVPGALKWAVAIVLALIIVVISVPEARAFVTEIIRIGAIQIFVGQPTPTSIPTALPAATRTATDVQPTSINISSVFEMPNETTFEDAVQRLKSPIQLPTYPDNIGQPDHVYVQDFGQGVLVTLVWLVPGEPDRVWLSLDILNDRFVANKFIDNDGQYHNVQVNNTPAQWITGLHEIGFFGNRTQIFRKVNGTVLIWLVGQDGKLTYRLEGTSSEEEAIRIAESLQDSGTP
ncbi:MAG: hypothetical protein GC179_12755 [Anaerolineaceae bacterium]|nr:hypothetical protein [Anaerolineaceae bacterium]